MQPICTHKISVQSSKPSHAYPIIRLPRKYRELAGLRAEVYQIAHQRKLAFLVVTDKQVDNSCLLDPEIDTEARLSALESQLAELQKLILRSASYTDADRENKRPRARFEPASWPPQGHRITKLPHLGTASKGV